MTRSGFSFAISLALCTIGAAAPTLAADLHSYAFVNDDGSLRIRGRTVHLYGIHIPPTDRQCRTYVRPVECRPRAILALDFKIASDFVRCDHQRRNDDGSYQSVCHANGVDLASYLLGRGWALALPDAPFEYVAQERIARHRGFGVWGFSVDSIQPRRRE